ncbi:MAG TPA: bacterial Ig-like domain-containing protein [Candidatus Coproplasma stercorigallinarum]|nr:bacterial Ig-like domain-containing protein [Candidatus Coproplasma stercorigallinarum]
MKKAVTRVVSVFVAVMMCVMLAVLSACADPVITSISLDTSAVTTTFSEGDAFTYDGLKVIGHLDNDTTQDIPLEECTVSTPDTSAVGQKEVTVTYQEFSAKYTIEVIHKCTQQCPVCGKCMDMECEDPVCAEKCGDASSYKTYTLQAEDYNVSLRAGARGELTTFRVIDDAGVTDEIKERNSDVVYIGNFNASAGATIEYNVWAEKDATATLLVSVCKRLSSAIFTQGVAVMVNNEMLERDTFVPSTGTGTDTWADFIDVNLGCIQLKSGMNNIQFMNISADFGYNFDNIKIKTDAKIGWSDKAEDAILEDADTSAYDAVITMAYSKDFVLAEIMTDEMQTYGKNFPAYTDHMGGAAEAGEDGRCFDGTKLSGQSLEFNFYMISKGTIYINTYMAAPEGYTIDDLMANVEFYLDGTQLAKDDIFINGKKGFKGRADSGASNPFVRVRLGIDGSEYVDLAAGEHTLTFKYTGDNAPDMDVIAIRPWTLGQYYTYTSLSVDASAAKTEYIMGEEFSSEGIVITATTRTGNQVTISAEDCDISTPDLSTMGAKTVLVKYEKVSASYTVNVKMDMGDLVQNIFEAEDTAHVTYGAGHMSTDGSEATPAPSGNKVGTLNANVGATLTFRIDGGEDGAIATLFASVCKRGSVLKFTDTMKITLNGTEISSEAVIPAFSASEWTEFEMIQLAQIELEPGENVIVFEVINGDVNAGFDFDSLMLASEETLGWFEG